MGLDTTHDCWHGPYSAFHRWRVWLAKQIGIPLNQMEGFSGDEPCIPWSILKERPVLLLLHHSDCDGEIKWQDAGPLADDLAKILDEREPECAESPTRGMDEEWYVEATRRFMSGCIDAHRNQENIEFA